MKNFAIQTADGVTHWVSRSVAVVSLILVKGKDSNRYVLANKRGNGAPDYVGMWNCPCGYLDYNETGEEGASRELFEETGFIIDPSEMKLLSISTDPRENRQNVVIVYYSYLNEDDLVQKEPEGGEENEVEVVRFININNIDDYEWAFGHDKLIKDYFGE